MKKLIKKHSQKHKYKLVAIATGAATAGVMYALWQHWFVLAAMFVLVMHELGHWSAAKKYGLETGYMVFAPLFLFMIGGTQIKGKHKNVAIAGPIFGLFAALGLFVVLSLMSLTEFVIPVLFLAFYESVSLFIGSDAKKFREASLAC